MSNLIGIMLVRNEADRYLRAVLGQMSMICDKLIVLDDCSTDKTPDICEKFGATVLKPFTRPMWTEDELAARMFLWSKATLAADPGDWIICLDADETLDNPTKLPVFINAVEQVCNEGAEIDAIGFSLFDMWNPTQYRDDGLWNAHRRCWPMIVKYDPNKDYAWNDMKLHCGRFPANSASLVVWSPFKLLHWGWAKQEDRKVKYDRYMEADPEGKLGSLDQYVSIMDANPKLSNLSDYVREVGN